MAKIKYEVGDYVEVHDDCDLCGDLAANQGTIVEIGNEGYLRFRVEEPWGDTKAGELYWIKDSWIYNFLGTPKPIPRVTVKLDHTPRIEECVEANISAALFTMQIHRSYDKDPINSKYKNLKKNK